ncbi:60S ribosomal protein L39 [Coemansia sp. RSA 1807]|nr:60S ribosomal protein L39 [Coemansia sp. RSA 2167]KAJ2165430.1 60S ribosomal protein L39 [Coemansia sp. RSA 562]KAJ2224084.1 60S ribosomal protein L39 [Coemansia sp. RSA 520]KAJ2282412.1 60S ribosomal protein L39 [Coemansia sp. RSA 370]KAJ2289440.1 60S ribosomal protein L39 [Coemansia sp. RSA 355]KAJ2425718.1 60S ribosomal protein L39 [Coemansia sp. RSA 2524]KAJ2435483.1 60S ribosomal protein L39 [Coemansia sp. RSA 2522]KAJ2575173.1 60S ribosomal protein L39 [Coemansia sp. RSA 1807]
MVRWMRAWMDARMDYGGRRMRNGKWPSNKSFRTKRTLGKKAKQNRPMPHWFRMKSETTKPYNTKRRNWRHSKLNL